MNKVILIGNLGKDPEIRYYEADQCVAKARLATTEKGYTLPNGTKVPDRTDWHNLVFYRRLAKVVERYVHKGDKIYVEGRLQYNNYTDKRGIERISCDIIVDNLELLSSRPAAQPSEQTATPSNTQQTAQQPVEAPSQAEQQSGEEILPF